MSLLQSFQHNISTNHLFIKKDKLLLAISGGVDSVVLCELCHQSGFDFVIAHCNFQLRGEESERDEQFVKELGTKYNAEVWVKRFDTEKYIIENKVSVQVAARDLRYAWFNELIEKGIAKYLLTAHHADDNAETIAMNFFRGTGLNGLTGMPAAAGSIRRPLLSFTRADLLSFLQENKLEFVEDSSNQSIKYTRNLFRHEVLPLVEQVYPAAKENLRDNIRRFSEIEQLYRFATGELKKKLCRQKGKELHIPVRQLLAYQSRALIYSIIEEYGFAEKQVDEVLKLAESDSGKFIQSPSTPYRIIRHRHWFIISPAADPEAATIVIEKLDKKVFFDAGELQLQTLDESKPDPRTGNDTAILDCQDIQFPLLLRKWKPGDYFYPLGMKKKKKLSRFFIDLKLSRPDKEKIWVLEMNKKILWVVGLRIDERFKVLPGTSKVLAITLTPNKC